MADNYFVCIKDCTTADGQRWYPGDKMPVEWAKDGKCPNHFLDIAGYEAKKKAESEALHREEVKNRLDSIRTDDPVVKGMSQKIINEALVAKNKKVKIPDKPLSANWKEGQKGPGIPPVAGPQPGSTVHSKVKAGKDEKIHIPEDD